MVFTYYGLSCVSIADEPGHGEVTTLLDPFENKGTLRMPRTLSAELVFMSKSGAEHGSMESVVGSPFVVSMPGEFEVKGIMLDVRSAPTKTSPEHKIARLMAEDILVGFLGALDRKPNEKELEVLEGVDILLLSLGAEGMSPAAAVETVQEVEPRVVVPLGESADIAAFRKAYGSVRTEEVSKWKAKKKDLPVEDMLMVVIGNE